MDFAIEFYAFSTVEEPPKHCSSEDFCDVRLIAIELTPLSRVLTKCLGAQAEIQIPDP